MEALKAEVAAKRKALQDDTTRPTKYMRRGDIERLQKEEEQLKEAKEREEAARREAEAEAKAIAAKASIVSLP
jgi:pre-mRNA-splicing factor 18